MFKILSLSFFVMFLASCMKQDVIETATKEEKEIIDSFTFENGVSEYVVDGKTVIDHQQIAKLAKDAWNIHYDFPNGKVVISTTPTEFEDYKERNIELKKQLTISDAEAKINDAKLAGDGTLANARTAANIVHPWYVGDFKSTMYFHLDNGSVEGHFMFNEASHSGYTHTAYCVTGSKPSPFLKTFKLQDRDEYDPGILILRNTSPSAKTKTVYAGTAYGGQSATYTLQANAHVTLPRSRLVGSWK